MISELEIVLQHPRFNVVEAGEIRRSFLWSLINNLIARL